MTAKNANNGIGRFTKIGKAANTNRIIDHDKAFNENWTRDLSLTKGVLYRWAMKAR